MIRPDRDGRRAESAAAAENVLSDKVVVVTGAGSGIGRGIAAGFCCDGAHVVGFGRATRLGLVLEVLEHLLRLMCVDVDEPDHQHVRGGLVDEVALRAALDIQTALSESVALSKTGLRTRIGVNTGPVIGVTIGTENRLSYTLLGDAVNVAARVEQLNKQFGTTILATESTVRAAGSVATCRPLGATDVRGHAGNIVVHSVDPA